MKIMRSNPTANGMKAVDVAARFRYRRSTRRRASLQDGVIRIQFIKVLREPVAGLICSACGYRYVNPDTWICGECGADHNELPSPEPEEDLCTVPGCINDHKPGYLWCEMHLAGLPWPDATTLHCLRCGKPFVKFDKREGERPWGQPANYDDSPPWPGGAA